jgi:hypothetical protein
MLYFYLIFAAHLQLINKKFLCSVCMLGTNFVLEKIQSFHLLSTFKKLHKMILPDCLLQQMHLNDYEL